MKGMKRISPCARVLLRMPVLSVRDVVVLRAPLDHVVGIGARFGILRLT